MICCKCSKQKEMSITPAFKSMEFPGRIIMIYRCTSCGASKEIEDE